MGKVYLIGAGPGDEELITIKAVKALKECTAVLYDRLAGNNILKYLNEDCKIYYCGKEPGCHYKSQDEINDMIAALAKEGHIVGRIKGGDPYVFGRGGEEGLKLCKQNIDFEVIPGVTSAISVLNYAGIPITHRKIAQSFHVFTGKSAEKLNVNWEAVAKLNGTLVFLMALGNIENITENLMAAGMNNSMPCAVIMKGTTSKQKKVIGKLCNITTKVKATGFVSPCIIVVGEVVQFNQQLSWYDKKPLFGQNVCVTRTKKQSKELSRKLLELGAEVTEINSIKIVNTSSNLDCYIKNLDDYDYIIFSSVNGVEIFFNYLKEKNFDIRRLKAKVAAIGPATSRSIKDKGIIPEIIADEFVGEDLLRKIKSEIKEKGKEKEKILIPCSRNSRKLIPEELRKIGCMVDDVHTYYPAVGEVNNNNAFKNVDIVLFSSPSTVLNMIKLVGIDEIRKKKCLAIGPITEKELIKNKIDCLVCDEYSKDGFIKKLLQFSRENKE